MTVAIPEQTLHGAQENKDPKTTTVNQNAPREETKTNNTREEHPHPPPDSESRLRQLHQNNKLESATVPELKEFLRNHNQKVSGKKEDLITRVQTLLSWNVFYSHLASIISYQPRSLSFTEISVTQSFLFLLVILLPKCTHMEGSPFTEVRHPFPLSIPMEFLSPMRELHHTRNRRM